MLERDNNYQPPTDVDVVLRQVAKIRLYLKERDAMIAKDTQDTLTKGESDGIH
jgi:hypothetical protein